MRILIYNRHFFPSIGGTEVSGRIMARELAALGHAVTVVTATPLPQDMAELDEGYRIVRNERFATLARLARLHDVLFSRGGVSLKAFLAARVNRTPFVAFHEIDAAAGRSGLSLRRRATDALKSVARRHAALHVVVSDALRDIIALPPSSRSFRLYNPVPEALWTEAPAGFADRDLDVVYVGRLIASKGLLVLRDALEALPERERLSVAIAGSGDDLDNWVARFGTVRGDVEILGPVEGDALRNLYARARVVVMPSLVNEGMGMVAAEALANGTPVCACDQPALREVVGDAGLFHPMGDAACLAQDLDRLLGDTDFWQALSERARNGRERFSMLQYRANLATLVDKCAAVGETRIKERTAPIPSAKPSATDDEEGRS